MGGAVVEALDLRLRVRVVGEPFVDTEPLHSDGDEHPPSATDAVGLDDPRHRADVEPYVATADFTPALDQHDSELAVDREAVFGERLVARLEDVQRKDCCGKSTDPSGKSGKEEVIECDGTLVRRDTPSAR